MIILNCIYRSRLCSARWGVSRLRRWLLPCLMLVCASAFGNGVPLNPGMNGAWFNPQTPGQGFFLEVYPETGSVFLGWFMWDTSLPDAGAVSQIGDPGHRWLTAEGAIDGNGAELDVFLTSGGLFDNPRPVTHAPEGILYLEFDSCSTGTVEYQLFQGGRFGVVPIRRLASDGEDYCRTFAETTTTPNGDGTTTVNYPLTGFTEVGVGGPFTVTLERSSVYSVAVRIDSDKASRLDVEKDGNTLSIGLLPNTHPQIETMEVTIRMPELTGLYMAGATNARIHNFEGDHFETALAGAANLSAFDVDFREITSQQAGACNLRFEQVRPIERANLTLGGASTARVNMTDGGVLTGKATSASTVEYYGTGVVVDMWIDILSVVMRLGPGRP